MTKDKSNATVAAELRQLADALAEQAHLPVVDSVHLFRGDTVYLSPRDEFGVDGARDVCAWAEALAESVTIKGKATKPELRAEFRLGPMTATIDSRLTSDVDSLYEALGWAPAKEGVEILELVAPFHLRTALDAIAGSVQRRKWFARWDALVTQSESYGAARKDAERWAAAKATEEMGPCPPLTGMAATIAETERVSEWHRQQADEVADEGGVSS